MSIGILVYLCHLAINFTQILKPYAIYHLTIEHIFFHLNVCARLYTYMKTYLKQQCKHTILVCILMNNYCKTYKFKTCICIFCFVWKQNASYMQPAWTEFEA